MEDFDPLNSPSRTPAEPIVSNSPFSALFASSISSNIEPPLIDFSSSPSPPHSTTSFQPKPLSLGPARQTLFPPAAPSKPLRSSPLKFSVLEDSFSDFPPSFIESTAATSSYSSRLSTLDEQECDEGGLVSFVQDSPPPSLRRIRVHDESNDKENSSPIRKSAGGRKWSVMHKLKEERERRRSRSLSPVKETQHGLFNVSTREGDSIAQIGNIDLSLIQDEGGSFLLVDDDSAVGQSFENDHPPVQSPGNLSLIGEEEEEEDIVDQPGMNRREEIVTVDEGISVGLSTMFLNKPAGEYEFSLIGDQSKFVGKTFDQSTLPRHFQPPKPFPGATSSSNALPPSKSSSILPPELVSPVKSRSNANRLPASASKPFHSLPTPAPSPPFLSHDQSHFSLALPHPEEHCSFLNKSSRSFIEECKSPRNGGEKGRISDMSYISEEEDALNSSSDPNSSDSSRRGGGFGVGVGEMTEFGFTQMLLNGSRTGETSTAILNQLPPNSIYNPESTRTIELCLQVPLRPNNSLTRSKEDEEVADGERDDLASSTRTIKASKSSAREEETDLMGMEEPSMLYQNQTLAFAGDLTMENQSIVVSDEAKRRGGGGGEIKESGAERLKRRMAELRAQQSLYTIPATPAARSNSSTSSSRFVSLLEQTPQAPPSFSSQTRPLSTVRRAGGTTLARSKSESLVGGGVSVGTLISFDTPSTSRTTASSSLATPARSNLTTTGRQLPRASLAPAATPLSRPRLPSSTQPVTPKTPGERKESTRARLERMRSERKQREEELLRKSASPEKPAAGGGGGTGLKRSNSVGSRSAGITRSQSAAGLCGTKGSAATGMKRGTSLADVRSARAGGGTTSTLTERMVASTSSSTIAKPRTSTAARPSAPRASTFSESMPPPASTSRRTSLAPPSSSTRLVKRPSLLPTTSSTASAPRPSLSSSSSRPPLRSTTASSSKPAGSGLARK